MGAESRIFTGDFTKIVNTFPAESVDAIITDPPYPKAYSYLWVPLGQLAYRALKPGGSLLSIVPHYLLPEVLETVGSQHMKYRWTHAMWQMTGSHPRMAMGIEVLWKPVVWWVKGSWPQGRGFTVDGFVNDPPGKEHHEWEQSLSWARWCLRLVPAGGTVLDPMAGSGTVGVACQETGHSFVGIDIDPTATRTARERLGLTAVSV